MNNYFVVNLENVNIEKNHPYTLVFKGYIPTFGSNNRLYTFKYDGEIAFTDSMIHDGTEITHSEMKPDGRVKVYIETPDEKVCFRHAAC